MEIEAIITYVVALVPSLAAVITTAVTFGKIMKNFAELRADVKKKVEMEELNARLQIAISENRELEKELKEAIILIKKIR